ncbi:MAG: alpha/beta fold hydrolase [Alphaproteobacteria bacterium]
MNRGPHPLDFFAYLAQMQAQYPAFMQGWMQGMPGQNNMPFTPEQMVAWQQQAQQGFNDFFTGMSAYHNHSYQRTQSDRPVIWSEGNTRVYDCSRAGSEGRPVLIVPSLINRSYILDLDNQRSMVQYMADQGLRPYIIDWGELDDNTRGYGFDDYLNRRLLAAIHSVGGAEVDLLGYCMGGLFTLAAAKHLTTVRKLVFLATPWDFHADRPWVPQWVAYMHDHFEQLIQTCDELPVQALNMMVAMSNPTSVLKKFQDMSQSPEISDSFVAVEDWVSDGVPMASTMARECLFGWYQNNQPQTNSWHVNGDILKPEDIQHECLSIIPTNDQIVPPNSSRALANRLPNGKALEVDLGHVGAIVGGKAPDLVWQPLVSFLTQ